MRKRGFSGLVLAAVLTGLTLSPACLLAGGVSDQIMQPGLYAGMNAEAALRYSLTRSLAPAPEAGWPGEGHGIALPEAVEGASLILARQGTEGARLSLTLAPPGEAEGRILSEMPGGAPNPVLLFWLENIVRVASVQTGGSPFYLRNRIREALVAAEISPDGAGINRLELKPFAALGPAEAARLGAFAGLRLEILWREEAPGRLLELKAETAAADAGLAGGYHEHLILQAEE